MFFTAWGLAATSTRAELLDNCRARPETVAAHTLELETWARTRAQLDDKYAADVKVVRAALIQRGLEDTDAAGREELAEQVAASGEPLVEFRKRDYDPEGTDLPALVRSKAGLLLDAIELRNEPGLHIRRQASTTLKGSIPMQQLTESQLQELRVNFAFWQAIEMVAGRAYPKTDAFNVIVADAAHFGALDGVRSAWARSLSRSRQSRKDPLESASSAAS